MTALNPTLHRYKEAGKVEAAPLPAGASTDPSDPAYRARATEAAVKFESYFIGDMLHKMRSATAALADPGSALKKPGNTDMLDLADNMVADNIASHRSFGIADALLRQLLPAPAVAPAHPLPGTPPAPPFNKPA